QHVGLRKTLLQDRADIARAAAEIDDPRRPLERHPGQQVERRTQPLALEPQILSGVPFGHLGTSYSAAAAVGRRASGRAAAARPARNKLDRNSAWPLNFDEIGRSSNA